MPTKQAREYGLRVEHDTGRWRCDFTANGKRVQRDTKTHSKAAALRVCKAWEEGAWKGATAPAAAEPTLTWAEAATAWRRHVEKDRGDISKTDTGRLEALNEVMGACRVATIKGNEIEQRLDTEQERRGWSNSTRNRYRAVISAVWNHSRIAHPELPPMPRVKRYTERATKLRFLTKDEAARLLAALPPYLRRMASFSLLTGLRQANVLNLRWDQIDLERKIIMLPAEVMKAGRDLTVPLNTQAIDTLGEAAHAQREAPNPYVFTHNGERVRYPAGKDWQAALTACGITDFRWHDLRRTFASWHVQAGTPLAVLQRLGGWASITQVMVYAQLSPDFTAQYADNARI